MVELAPLARSYAMRRDILPVTAHELEEHGFVQSEFDSTGQRNGGAPLRRILEFRSRSVH